MKKLALSYLVVALAICALSSTGAFAMVDQQNDASPIGGAGSGNVTNHGPGQTFTPTLNALDAATFLLLTSTGDLTLRLDLFEGIGGYNRPRIGSSNLVTVAGAAP